MAEGMRGIAMPMPPELQDYMRHIKDSVEQLSEEHNLPERVIYGLGERELFRRHPKKFQGNVSSLEHLFYLAGLVGYENFGGECSNDNTTSPGRIEYFCHFDLFTYYPLTSDVINPGWKFWRRRRVKLPGVGICWDHTRETTKFFSLTNNGEGRKVPCENYCEIPTYKKCRLFELIGKRGYIFWLTPEQIVGIQDRMLVGRIPEWMGILGTVNQSLVPIMEQTEAQKKLSEEQLVVAMRQMSRRFWGEYEGTERS